MKAETIKAIFTNVLFVIGVILLIFGFINGSLTIVRLFTFEKYPLNAYEESRCDLEPMAVTYTPDGKEQPMSNEEIQQRKQKCVDSVEYQRRIRKTEDIVIFITTLTAGAALVLGFKRFIFK